MRWTTLASRVEVGVKLLADDPTAGFGSTGRQAERRWSKLERGAEGGGTGSQRCG